MKSGVFFIVAISELCFSWLYQLQKTRSSPWFWLVLFLIPACATYEPMPLDQATVAARLAPPSMEAIQVQAKEIQHPVLKPIEFDIRNGLSPRRRPYWP